jgi:hypothetical protein
MVSCGKCNGANAESAKFCVHCGAKVELPPPAAAGASFKREYDEERQKNAGLQSRLSQIEAELRTEKAKTARLEGEVSSLRSSSSASAAASPRAPPLRSFRRFRSFLIF